MFLLFAGLMVVLGKWLILLNGVLAVLIHEYAHVVVARSRGYRLTSLTMLPCGGTISAGKEKINRTDDVVISLAGPICNLAIFVILAAGWWYMPFTFPITYNLGIANLGVGLFNLLPIYPLDASRIILALSSARDKALCRLRYGGIMTGIIGVGLFILSIFFTINFNLLILGITVLISATVGIGREENMESLKLSGLIKNNAPLKKECYTADEKDKVAKLQRLIKSDRIISLEVTRNKNVVKVIGEDEVVELLAKSDKNDSIAEGLKKLKNQNQIRLYRH